MKKLGKAINQTISLTLNIAINYGGRDEIVRAQKNFTWKPKNNQLDPNDITP